MNLHSYKASTTPPVLQAAIQRHHQMLSLTRPTPGWPVTRTSTGESLAPSTPSTHPSPPPNLNLSLTMCVQAWLSQPAAAAVLHAPTRPVVGASGRSHRPFAQMTATHPAAPAPAGPSSAPKLHSPTLPVCLQTQMRSSHCGASPLSPLCCLLQWQPCLLTWPTGSSTPQQQPPAAKQEAATTTPAQTHDACPLPGTQSQLPA